MMKASTIVCLIDASSATKHSLPIAAKLAADMEARLVLVHPVTYQSWSIYNMATFNFEHERVKALEQSERLAREIMKNTPEVQWEIRAERGQDDDIVEAVAKETGADLVISARHRGRLEVLQSFPARGVLESGPQSPGLETPMSREHLAADLHQHPAVANY